MAISDFPAALQPIIQEGFLEREFLDGLTSELAYRQIAEKQTFPIGIGETQTKTRPGLKAPVTKPLAPASNTNFDNGLTADGWAVEQFTIKIDQYAATMDLNLVTTRVGIKGQFLENAKKNGTQAAQSLDELARNALFDTYLGGNTYVATTLGSAGTTLAVDDVRGFGKVFVEGVPTAVSTTHKQVVAVNGTAYNLVAVATDATNASKAPGGQSGTLTFDANVTVADGTKGNSVVASTAPVVLRPSGRASTTGLVAGDTLTMATLLDARTALRRNNVPMVRGYYNCYADPISMRGLFADPDFKELYRGATADTGPFQTGMIVPMLGLRFIETTEAYLQDHPTTAGLTVHRPIVVGADALIEGTFEGQMEEDVAPALAMRHEVNKVVMVTRAPMDRLQQIIAQSWYWIGGYVAPSDTTANPTVIPTATNAAFKRAVVIEHT